MITRNRCRETLRSLRQLAAPPDPAPAVVVVDNGSDDGTPDAVRRAFPQVTVIEAGTNLGAAGRSLGVAAARTPYIAFADDDSWWAPGALRRAAAVLDRHPRVAVLAGLILVGPGERPDPVCAAMAHSPVPGPPTLPGPAVLGFVACGAVVRRDAYRAAGGFHPRYGVGGEEALLALDLAASGWWLCYHPGVVAHHHPSSVRDPQARRAGEVRNDLWTGWLRLPLATAVADTAVTALRSPWSNAHRRGLADAVRSGSWVVRSRRPVPPMVVADVRALRRTRRTGRSAATMPRWFRLRGPRVAGRPSCDNGSSATRR